MPLLLSKYHLNLSKGLYFNQIEPLVWCVKNIFIIHVLWCLMANAKCYRRKLQQTGSEHFFRGMYGSIKEDKGSLNIHRYEDDSYRSLFQFSTFTIHSLGQKGFWHFDTGVIGEFLHCEMEKVIFYLLSYFTKWIK